MTVGAMHPFPLHSRTWIRMRISCTSVHVMAYIIVPEITRYRVSVALWGTKGCNLQGSVEKAGVTAPQYGEKITP